MTLTQIRRTLFITFISLIIIGILLLLNFTAPNPTHRRYSSQTIDVAASTTDKGIEGEDILSRDLGIMLTNERSLGAEVACVCNRRYEGTAPPHQCTVCSAYSESVANHRIPDFVASRYIAESKNSERLTLSHTRDYQQIQEIAAAAIEINQPLWVYVRTDTYVAPEFYDITRSTGGDVVRYFRTPMYADVFDQIGRILLIIGGTGIVIILGWEAISYVYRQIPDDPESSNDTVDDAVDAVDETEDFMRRVERLSRKEIDKKNDDHKKR